MSLPTAIFSLVGALTAVAPLAAQVTFVRAPASGHFYARADATAGFAEARISGLVDTTAGGAPAVDTLYAALVGPGGLVDRDTAVVDVARGGRAFALMLRVPARRRSYRVEVFADPAGPPLLVADDVVAGDVFLVNGQSNAEANGFVLAPDRSPFVRGYNDSGSARSAWAPGWVELNDAPGGVWAGRMALRLSEARDVPIAVFNLARGGQAVDYFVPGAPSGNFERVFSALREAGVRDRVRAVLWSQGERNGYGQTRLTEYREALAGLFERYRDSLATEQIVLLQTRPFACSGTVADIAEAQRRLAAADPHTTLFATTNLVVKPDRCHYPSEGGGYDLLGERLALLLRDLTYGESLPGAYAPQPDSARVTGPREITVFTDATSGGLAASGAPWRGFVAEGLGARATSGQAFGDRVVLGFDRDIGAATGLSHHATLDGGLDYVHHVAGPGLATWYDLTLTAGDGAAGSAVDAELDARLARPGAAAVGDTFSLWLSLANAGRTTLTAPQVFTTAASAFGYVGVDSAQSSDGVDFDPASGLWHVARLRPGERARIALVLEAIDSGAVAWAQLARADEASDPDSTPRNRQAPAVREDDEVRVVPTRREADCALRARVANSFCAPDTSSLWEVRLDVDATRYEDLLYDVMPAAALLGVDPATRRLFVSFDSLAALDTVPLGLTLRRVAGGMTCEATLPSLVAPDSCKITPVVSVERPVLLETGSGLRAYPNPVSVGRPVTVEGVRGQLRVYDVQGRLVVGASAKTGTPRARPTTATVRLPRAGVYVLRDRGSAVRVVVE